MTCLWCCFWASNYEKKKNEKYMAEGVPDRCITAKFLHVGVRGIFNTTDDTP